MSRLHDRPDQGRNHTGSPVTALSSEVRASLAAILFAPADDVDGLLEEVVRTLKTRGLRVAGYLQRQTAEAGCCSLNHLESISDGRRILISQPLGSGSRGCRLDPRGLAEASQRLLEEMETRPDILVLNRFGKGEADGQGLRAAIEKAFVSGVPVLTAVRALYLPAWKDFSGGLSAVLRPEARHVLAWCGRACEFPLAADG